MKRTRVLIVDDHCVVRRGLRRYLELVPELELAGEAASGREALTLAAQLAPDVILLDLMMPEMGGLEATAALTQLAPLPRVIIITSFCDAELVVAALRAGAAGFLMKDVGVDELTLAIRTAQVGQPYLTPYAARQLLGGNLGPEGSTERLTDRERQVYALVARGMSNKQIGAELGMSAKTTSVHLSNLMSKLGLRSRTQVALHALGVASG